MIYRLQKIAYESHNLFPPLALPSSGQWVGNSFPSQPISSAPQIFNFLYFNFLLGLCQSTG